MPKVTQLESGREGIQIRSIGFQILLCSWPEALGLLYSMFCLLTDLSGGALWVNLLEGFQSLYQQWEGQEVGSSESGPRGPRVTVCSGPLPFPLPVPVRSFQAHNRLLPKWFCFPWGHWEQFAESSLQMTQVGLHLGGPEHFSPTEYKVPWGFCVDRGCGIKGQLCRFPLTWQCMSDPPSAQRCIVYAPIQSFSPSPDIY